MSVVLELNLFLLCECPSVICSILGYIKASGLSNIKEPLSINTTEPIKQWADGALVEASYDLILCINMMHISEWPATEVG